MGSAITYARRYALATGLGVPSFDDDGNEASGLKMGNQATIDSLRVVNLQTGNQASVAQRSAGPEEYYLYYIIQSKLTEDIKKYLDDNGAVHKEYGLWRASKELPKLKNYKITPEEWSVKIKEIYKAKRELLDRKAKPEGHPNDLIGYPAAYSNSKDLIEKAKKIEEDSEEQLIIESIEPNK